jgi:osmoprotectant transport system ATP-binding protein
LIRLEAVRKEFPGQTVAVDHLDLEIADGETCVLLGPSGCGKTTTLRMINRLIEPSAGRILLDDEDVTHIDPVLLRLRMGYVIQQTGLFPHLTVADNVATVPRLLGWDRARIRARVDDLLDLVGLPPDQYRERYPHQLSGGQRQRVGFARGLGADPPVLLMDEPFGAVDRITRERLQNEFIHIQREMRKTVVFVTHDIDEAVKVGDRIALMSVRARIEQHDTPVEILGHPATPFVAEFLGRDRLLKSLAVTPIDPETLESRPSPTGDGARVEIDGTLNEALERLLETGLGWVPVYRGERYLGAFTAASLQASIRAASERRDRERPLDSEPA